MMRRRGLFAREPADQSVEERPLRIGDENSRLLDAFTGRLTFGIEDLQLVECHACVVGGQLLERRHQPGVVVQAFLRRQSVERLLEGFVIRQGIP